MSYEEPLSLIGDILPDGSKVAQVGRERIPDDMQDWLDQTTSIHLSFLSREHRKLIEDSGWTFEERGWVTIRKRKYATAHVFTKEGVGSVIVAFEGDRPPSERDKLKPKVFITTGVDLDEARRLLLFILDGIPF